MAHDVPLGCAPDEYDDLISGTCSHLPYKGLYERWWQFWNNRADLMRKLRKRNDFIAFAKVTKYPFCLMAPTDWNYTNKILLIEVGRKDLFAICLSSFFRNWLYAFSVRSLGADTNTLTLSIREAVSTFALPKEMVSNSGQFHAARFQELIINWSDENQSGITEALNSVNNPNCKHPTICELRKIMAAIDVEVAQAYGWEGLDISYDFRKFDGGSSKDPWRWAISEDLTAELMSKLIELNRHYVEGLSGTKGNVASSDARR
ncbi:TPA: hypothetical protein RFV31_003826 [Klebsiella pneumoniae]|nr:hypothetical protein [Klebsiella pneumoniae]